MAGSIGSLTRYYLEGAADVLEPITRHQGMAVDDGKDAEEVIRAAVLRWRERLSRWLGDRLAERSVTFQVPMKLDF